jgi:chromosome partitioning protein
MHRMGVIRTKDGLKAGGKDPLGGTIVNSPYPGGDQSAMRTIATVNQKGGSGKTTSAINLAAALAEQRKNVLLIDLDPQAHATIGLGFDPDTLERTVYDALTDPQIELADVVQPTRMDRLVLAPASFMLVGADIELRRVPRKELVLHDRLRSVRDRFDVCVMDCPPSFSVLTVSALVASADVIVPVRAHYYSMEGLRLTLETIRLIRDYFHPYSAENLNILLTLVDDRTTVSRQIQVQLREIFGTRVFHTVIHNNVRVCEAPSAGESVLLYAPRSRGAWEYRALAAEVLGGAEQIEPARRKPSRRGLQKDLSALLRDLEVPAKDACSGMVRTLREPGPTCNIVMAS